MSAQTVESFIAALGKLEASHEVEAIVSTFTEDCKLGNAATPKRFSGRDGAREFWRQYRDTFGEMKSTFRNVIATEDRVALEWATEGTIHAGAVISYEGVSILELEGGAIKRFHAYFDSKELSGQIVKEVNAWTEGGSEQWQSAAQPKKAAAVKAAEKA
jgi:ketosteroid isomerase-like protein